MNNIITLVGADARFTASIAQLLKFKTKGQYSLGADGGITLVDADSIDGRRAIEKYLDDTTILLTVSPENYDHKLILRKPFKVEELVNLIESLEGIATTKAKLEITKETADAQIVSGNPFAKFSDPEYLANKKKKKEAVGIDSEELSEAISTGILNNALMETAFLGLKGKVKELNNVKQYKSATDLLENCENSQFYEKFNLYLQTDDIYFDMLDYATVHLCADVHAGKFADKIVYFESYNGIIILFSDGVLISNLSDESLHDFSEMKKDQVGIQAIESEEQLIELLNRYDEFYYDDALVFLSRSVLSLSKGRIINKKSLTDPLGLMKHKENVQFPIVIPNAKDMDGIWGFRNVSLRDTAELLPEVSPYYIFSYYTLCYLYGFLGADVTETKSKDHLDLNALLTELQSL